jgi:hypothetical protein
MGLAGNQGSSQAADKALKKKKPKQQAPKSAAPPTFPTRVPVRPGAVTNRFSSEPSTQAQRTHVHKARIARNKELAKSQAQHDVPTTGDLSAAAKFNAANPTRHEQHASDIYLTDPAALKAAGFKPGPNLLKTLGNAERATANAVAAAVSTGFGGAKVGDIASAKVTGHKNKKLGGPAEVAQKVAENFGKDLVDIPASVVPSVYQIARHPKSAPELLVDPYVELAKHPGKSLVEHPLGSALLAAGAEGAVGRGLGKGLRTLPSKATKSLGSLERPATTRSLAENPAVVEPGKYSKDIFVKGAQAASDRLRGRKPGVMTDAQVKRRVDEYMSHGEVNHKAFKETFGDNPVANQRFEQHLKQNAPPNTSIEKALELYNRAFRKAVLAVSPKWFTGNVVEAAARSLIAHAGPRSYYTAHKALGELKRIDPEAHARLQKLSMPGGQAHMIGQTEHTAAEALAGTRLADVARAFSGGKPAQVWHAYTRFVFDSLNGKIESQFQKAQLGKALRDSNLMSDKTVKVSQRAIDDAAKGLTDTNAQVQLAREVNRAYGQYHSFSPSKRYIIRTYTPFAAWTFNAAKFLADVLPRDHPVLTSMLASANQATEEWRKDHGLVVTLGKPLKGAVPGWLRGSIPGAKGSHLRLSKYTPFGLLSSEGGAGGTVAGALLPQIMSVYNNLQGTDWKGSKLGGGEAQNYLAAALSLLENTIPAANIEAELSGKHLPNEAKGAKHPKSLAARARKQFDPFMVTPASEKKSKKHKGGHLPQLGSGGLPDLRYDILDGNHDGSIEILGDHKIPLDGSSGEHKIKLG